MPNSKNIVNYMQGIWTKDRNPDSLAIGLAVGLFMAFLPLPAFQAVIAFFAAHLLKGNRILAVGATLISNWLTMAPIFLGAVWVGSLILPGVNMQTLTPSEYSWNSIRDISGEVLSAYVTGTLFFSFATASLGYILLKFYAKKQEKLRWQRIQDP